MKVLRDTWLIFQRHILLMVRSPLWVFLGIAQPVVFLVLFAPLLKPALGSATMLDAYRVYVPGMLVALAIGGGLYVGFGLLGDLANGSIERARVTTVSRVALLLGRALRDVVTVLVQSILITLLSLPFGLILNIGNILLGYAILALISLAAAAISYGIAIKVSNPNVLGQVINNLAMPLMLLSGTLLPLALAPLWLRTIANYNPFYWAVTGMRELYTGSPGNHVLGSLVFCGAIVVAAVAWSASLFARSVK
ncbi:MULTISPECIES: ABC transporter permease [Dactylosporangium]|uniref:Transport permease protein n=2 Tax=Dactylosporangium TaxID=35753 RepID=A0A9W6KI26_9ACTN|nr:MULTISPECIES: ABC transporter permease [Dactylosporangium]UAB99063.1 ABC transporter permease [Dactylosporangium vinaceum]UWZ47305.1 ABC transporter permease [Dactylosporangium matsuzakiense]GLL01357.1 transport permease protein [Dactylosporangium matsuzakiense]